MNVSPRTISVFTRGVAVLLLLVFVGPAGLVQGPAAADPNQAVVLDGSTDSSAVYYVAFTDNGLQISVVTPPAPCPGASHVPQAGLFPASQPAVGIYQFDGSDDGTRVVAPPVVTLPPNLDDFQDDCDILAGFSEVVAYLDDMSLEATDLIDQMDDCVQEARSAYCQLVELIANPEIEEHPESEYSGMSMSVNDTTVGSDQYSDSACDEFLVMLVSTPKMLESMQRNLLSCQEKVAFMETWAAEILAKGYILSTREQALARADNAMSRATEQSAQAHQTRNQINDVKGRFSLGEVVLSCEQCDDSPPGDPLIPLSGAVLVQTRRTPLDRYAVAFREAAADVSDRLAQRLFDIARRLSEIPDGRVHHVTFKSTSGIGQDYLALAPAGAPDDGRSPRVVVLTALDRHAELPPMNAADQSLLFDGLRTFLERFNITGNRFLRGDANTDGTIDLSDAIFTLGCQFLGTECPTCSDAADSNDDGALDLSDAIYTLTWSFLGGPPPADPGPTDCGLDPTDDALDCGLFDPCVGG